MRWQNKTPQLKTRTVRRFAILPITLKPFLCRSLETRWLEWVRIRQDYICGNYGCAWMDDCFVEKWNEY